MTVPPADKTDKTPPAISATEAMDRIKRALDKTVRFQLDTTVDERVPAGMSVIMRSNPSWWFTEGGDLYFPTLTEGKTAELVERAKSDPHAYDAAAYLSAVQLSFGKRTGLQDCPDSLISFGVRVISGDLKRPTQKGRKHRTDIPLQMVQYALCWLVAKNLPVPLGRNRETERAHGLSAFELVAEAFCRGGKNTDARQLESLYYDVGYADVRELAEACGLLDYKNGIIWPVERPARPEK
jgi:hypothetical protein